MTVRSERDRKRAERMRSHEFACALLKVLSQQNDCADGRHRYDHELSRAAKIVDSVINGRNMARNDSGPNSGGERVPFVKLDCGILTSTIWDDTDARIIFITALLMAEPREYREPVPQIKVRAIEETGFVAPVGWYGYVPAAGPGIVNRAGVEREAGLDALVRLGDADTASRSSEFEGRRLIRIDGGYLILNFQKYRDRDYTAAERMRRYRARLVTRHDATVTRHITQVEGEVEERSKRKKSTAKRPPSSKQEVPEDFQPSEENIRRATVELKMTVSDIAAETVKFISWHRAKGNTFKRPELAWWNWVAGRFVEKRGQPHQTPHFQAAPMPSLLHETPKE